MNFTSPNEFFLTQKRVDRITIYRVNIQTFFQLSLVVEAITKDKTNSNLMLEFLRLTTNIRRPKKRHLKYFKTAYNFNIPKLQKSKNQAQSKIKSTISESIISMIETIASEHFTPISDILYQYNIFQVLILLDSIEKRHARQNADLLTVIAGAQYSPEKTLKRLINYSQGRITTQMSISEAMQKYNH